MLRPHFGLLIRALDSRKMSIKPNQTKPNQTTGVVLGLGAPRLAERSEQCPHFGLLIRALDSRKMSINPNQTKPDETVSIIYA